MFATFSRCIFVFLITVQPDLTTFSLSVRLGFLSDYASDAFRLVRPVQSRGLRALSLTASRLNLPYWPSLAQLSVAPLSVKNAGTIISLDDK